MKVSYSPQLMEESVFRHLNHLERSGYRADYDEFHSLADPIYEPVSYTHLTLPTILRV